MRSAWSEHDIIASITEIAIAITLCLVSGVELSTYIEVGSREGIEVFAEAFLFELPHPAVMKARNAGERANRSPL